MKKIILIMLGFILFLIVYLNINEQILNVPVNVNNNVLENFVINKGDGSTEVGKNLEKAGLIKNKYYFWYFIWRQGVDGKLQAGKYQLSRNMTIPQITDLFVKGKVKKEINKLVVPEGATNDKIIQILKKQKLELVDDFTNLVECRCLNQIGCACDKFSQKYDFIHQIPAGLSLEGYLFPDTYFIAKDETGKSLVDKFLANFKRRVDDKMLADIQREKISLHKIITMASIVEREVKDDSDRPIVAGIFYNRLEKKYPLQSDATLSYILKVNKIKYTLKDLNYDSPYNTYKYKGLPPGPICNPGIKSIEAAINPRETNYFYFLNDAYTGETVFSVTNNEHNVNKIKHGL